MCGVSGIEFMVILVVAVIVLGPDRLPEVMRTLGKMARELRKITDDFSEVRDEFTKGIREDVEKDLNQSSSAKSTAKRRAKAGRAGQDVPEIDAIRAKRAQSASDTTSDTPSEQPNDDGESERMDAPKKRPLPPTLKPAAGVVESQGTAAQRTVDADDAAEPSASKAPADSSSDSAPSDIDRDSGKDA